MAPRVPMAFATGPKSIYHFIRETFFCSMKLRNKTQTLLSVLLFILPFFTLDCGNELQLGKRIKKDKVVVAVDATLIPMTFVGENSELTGFEVDLIRQVAREAKFAIELVNVEWAGLFGGLVTRKFDAIISSVTILEE